MIIIKEVKSSSDIAKFINFPLSLYADCPYFVPPLYSDEKKLLKSGGNSEHFKSIFFIALRDKRVVGRIQGIIQHQHNKKKGEKRVRFNRFDCIDDQEVANALFCAVEKWAKSFDMTEICGPLGFNDLDREGLLVEGFNEYSTFEEQYNYEYYGTLIERAGFKKEIDWVEYELKKPKQKSDNLARIAKRSLELNGLHLADNSISKHKYIQKYRDGFFETLDVCYRHLYGTVEITKDAQDELVKQFIMILNKKYLMFLCDKNEKVVGFGLCFPAIGPAVKKSGGKLTPITLLKILKCVKKPKTVDLVLVAVRPEYQKLGVNAVFLDAIANALNEGVIESCETNLNLETNVAVQSQWKHFDARQHKLRRAYVKDISF